MNSVSSTRTLSMLLATILALSPLNVHSQENTQPTVNSDQEKKEYFHNGFATGAAFTGVACLVFYLTYQGVCGSSDLLVPPITELIRKANQVKNEAELFLNNFLNNQCTNQLVAMGALDDTVNMLAKNLREKINQLRKASHNVYHPFTCEREALSAIETKLIDLYKQLLKGLAQQNY